MHQIYPVEGSVATFEQVEDSRQLKLVEGTVVIKLKSRSVRLERLEGIITGVCIDEVQT